MPTSARPHGRRPWLVAALLTVLVVAACTPPTPMFDLDVSVTGDGSGAVTSSPVGIDTAGGDGTASFAEGTVVTLTAAPAAGSAFLGFTFSDATTCEAGSTATSCIVTMDADASVSAEFEAEQFVVAASGIRLDALRFASSGRTTSDTATLPGTGFDPNHTIFGLAWHPTQPWLFVSSMIHQQWADARIDVFAFEGGAFDHVATNRLVDYTAQSCVDTTVDPAVDYCAVTEMAFNPTGTELYVNADFDDLVLSFAVDTTTAALTYVAEAAPVWYQGLVSHPSEPYLYNGLNVIEVVAGVPETVGTDVYENGGNGTMVLATASGLRLLSAIDNRSVVLADLVDPASPNELDRIDLNGSDARFASADVASQRTIVVGNDIAGVMSFAGDTLTDLGPTILERLDPATTRVFRGVAWVPGTDHAVAAWFDSNGAGGHSILDIAVDGSVTIAAELPGAGRAIVVRAQP